VFRRGYLFCMRQAVPRGKGLVEQVLYLLWDMGLAVGSSFRSVSGA